jgi:hypothetical protein
MMGAIWDLNLHEPVFLVLRCAAALGAAVVGWFLAGPLVRLLVKAAFHKSMSSGFLIWFRMGGAALAGILVFHLIQGFGGGGGSGFGLGTGGPGKGGPPDKQAGDKAGTDKTDGDSTLPTEVMPIELLGAGERYKNRYKGDDHYYLLDRKDPGLSTKEIEKFFQEKKGKLVVEIILTPDSVSESSPAVRRLQRLADKYKLFHRLKKEGPDTKSGGASGL